VQLSLGTTAEWHLNCFISLRELEFFPWLVDKMIGMQAWF
jgi:hypothetical protein